MKTLGAKSITAIVVPEAAAAYHILALNTEKAHNLREKALEVIRMYKELARLAEMSEEAYALEFEEPALITLGLCYQERPRFSGGAYHPVLKRVDEFLKQPLRAAMQVRQKRAGVLAGRVRCRQTDVVAPRQLRHEMQAPQPPASVGGPKTADFDPENPHERIPVSIPAGCAASTRPSRTARRCLAMGMSVLGFDPYKPAAATIKLDDLARSGGAPDEGE